MASKEKKTKFTLKIKQFEGNPELKFCKVRKQTKKPFEKDWVNKPYSWEEIQDHISKEANAGAICGYGGLAVADGDTPELREAIEKNLPETFTVRTGGGGIHSYFICKELDKKIVLQNDEKHFGEIQSHGSQVIIPNSIHPNGNKYEIIKNKKIAKISKEDLIKAVAPFMKEVKESEVIVLKELKNYGSSDINSIPITSVMDISGFKRHSSGELYGTNKWHGSETGQNTWINESKNVAHCFRCNAGINVAQAIALNEGIISICSDKLTKEQFKQVLEVAYDKYGLKKPTPEQVQEQSHDLKTFIFDKDQIIQKRVFSSHLLNDTIFGFGIMLPREEDITNKKNEVIGQVQRWRPVVITSNKRGLVVSKWMEKEYKVTYECIPDEMKLRWELKDVDNYLHQNPVPTIDGKELFGEIKKEYKYYLFYREGNWYDIHSLWDMGTYLHQLFSSYPLFENRGWKGTGKTQTMVVSSYISLNGTEIMTNPSESTLFRETESTRPSKYIDEAEKLFKLGKFGLEPDNRVELINSSYSRNGVVPRQEKLGSSYVTKWYHVYSPTMISSIQGLFGATEDRAISQIHTKSPDKDKRGERDPEDDVNDPKWSKIRNKCYLWALQNWKKVYNEYLNFNVDTTLKKRDLQIWKPLLVIAKAFDKNLLSEVLKFAEKLSKQKKMDNLGEGTLDYKLLKCLDETIKHSDSERIYVNKIREQYNFNYVDEESKDKKKNLKKDVGFNHTITSRLDKLGFRDLKDKDRVGAYYELTKTIFDEIVEPLTSDFTSQSSQSSHIDDINKNNVIESDNNEESVMKKCDDCDANDDCDDGLTKKNIFNLNSTDKKNDLKSCVLCGSEDAFIVKDNQTYCKECAYK